tara:strand:+ start:162 stop:413 length:252 start_codon:yes stop_codon:yes gene_type:complete
MASGIRQLQDLQIRYATLSFRVDFFMPPPCFASRRNSREFFFWSAVACSIDILTSRADAQYSSSGMKWSRYNEAGQFLCCCES